MRTLHILGALVIVPSFLHPIVAERIPLKARQNDNQATSSNIRSIAPTTTLAAATTTLIGARSSTSLLARASSGLSSSIGPLSKSSPSTQDIQSSSIAGTSSVVQQTPTTTTGLATVPSATTGTSSGGNSLPVPPKITPAIGISGVILLASGIIYTVIGIKSRWLYIFLSSAYLASLAVTVLTVYVMNPPVTDAVQGAFFIAACLTGVVLGGVSLIFTEVTDGLGCLLGGFCLSMWFLVLRPGGLIRSNGGRAIFIGVLTVVAFSLSFSQYTRTYGLIVCIAFGGATATILGIDCFSRAGLKEFWLYVWDLNEDIFPLYTDTYPITRGIRVEIAGIVLIFLAGIISQLKLWKLIKERREKKAADRSRQEEDTERLETEVGRRLEDDISRERARWEAVYGDKKPAPAHDDSGNGSRESVAKSNMSIRELENSGSDNIEMDDLSRSKEHGQLGPASARTGAKKPGAVLTVHVASDDDIQQIDADGNPVAESLGSQGPSTQKHSSAEGVSGLMELEHQPDFGGQACGSTEDSIRSSVPPPPVIVPLPFTIPVEENSDMDDNASSASTIPETLHERRRASKRASGSSKLKRLSLGKKARDVSASREDLIVPHIEDDRASSIAATIDDIDGDKTSLPALSPPHSPYSLDVKASGPLVASTTQVDPEEANEHEERPLLDLTETSSEQNNEHTPTELPGGHNPAGESDSVSLKCHESNPVGEQPSLTSSTNPKPDDGKDKRISPRSQRRSGIPAPDPDDVQGQPESNPAKSVSLPEGSDHGTLEGSLKDYLPEKLSKVAMSYRTNEWAKHLELAEKPEIEELVEPSSPGIKVDHSFAEASQNTFQHSTNPYRQARHVRAVSNPSGPTPYEVLGSSSLTKLATRGLRNSSAPLTSHGLVQSPVEEESFYRYSSTPNVAVIAPSDSASVRNIRLDEPEADNISLSERKQLIEQENMTLAERKQMIQRQRELEQQQRQGTWPLPHPSQGFNSHQPRRTSGIDQGKREAMLATWRESVRRDLNASQPLLPDEGRRAAMINDRRQSQIRQQQQAMAVNYRDSVFDSMMRRGDMLDLHREAIRKMQATANKHA